ncbi:MAG: universal stress protein [Bacteroidetes bacterium]|nr:MAG: universal stress protein [Bacteroidota bacterium]
MKEIVVGIDFSQSSIQAFQYALNISKACGCSMKLVYVSKKRDKSSKLIKNDKGMEISIEENFKKLIEEHSGELKGSITHKVLHGKIYEEITNQAKYTDAEMIVSGAHGMSGFEELWVGNNAMKIITHSEKPVLSVKKNYKLKKPLIEKIVLPIDSTMETIQKVDFTIRLAGFFKAQINVLSLYSSKLKNIEESVERNTREAMELIVASGLRYINENKNSDNLSKATIEYAQKRNADLISIMTEQENSSNNVFLGNYAQQTINQSPLPVLTFRTRHLPRAYNKLE